MAGHRASCSIPNSDFAIGETCTITIVAPNVTDQDTSDPPDAMSGNYVWSFTTEAPPPPPVAIHDVQGATHISPYAGQTVIGVPGIVTAKRSNGYYLQDPSPDANDKTSEGIFVFTSSAPTVSVGDAVSVSGTVAEFRPGGAASASLTTPRSRRPRPSCSRPGNPLPAPTMIGTGGRVPPNGIIEDDATGDVETSGVFDPASDGIDFCESLEGMRVQVNNAVVVGPTRLFREIPVVGDNGARHDARPAAASWSATADTTGDYARATSTRAHPAGRRRGRPTTDADVGDPTRRQSRRHRLRLQQLQAGGHRRRSRGSRTA